MIRLPVFVLVIYMNIIFAPLEAIRFFIISRDDLCPQKNLLRGRDQIGNGYLRCLRILSEWACEGLARGLFFVFRGWWKNWEPSHVRVSFWKTRIASEDVRLGTMMAHHDLFSRSSPKIFYPSCDFVFIARRFFVFHSRPDSAADSKLERKTNSG